MAVKGRPPLPDNQRTEEISVRLKKATLLVLQGIAKATGRKRSELIREACEKEFGK